MRLLVDDDLEQEARNTLLLMNAGIPYDAVMKMHPRMKAAFLRALASICGDDGSESGEGGALLGEAS